MLFTFNADNAEALFEGKSFCFFLIGIVGVESNWVHSALRPPIGLLCQPRAIMVMENLVE
jgi:hypothetical protein